jgi:hypothetical protein
MRKKYSIINEERSEMDYEKRRKSEERSRTIEKRDGKDEGRRRMSEEGLEWNGLGKE